MDSVIDQSRASDDFPVLQDHQATVTKRLAQPHHTRWIDSDLLITATPEGHMELCQPLPATSLRLDDYEAPMENSPRTYSFGLEGAGSTYPNAAQHLFVDHVECNHITDLYVIDPTDPGQPAPVVNMVSIPQLSEDYPRPTQSLHHVLDESPDDSS